MPEAVNQGVLNEILTQRLHKLLAAGTGALVIRLVQTGCNLRNLQVVESGPSPQHAAVRALLQRGLLAALAGGRQLSQHPAAAGAVFRLLLLALQTAGCAASQLLPPLQRHA
jgi:hypothetical protein